VIGSKHVGLIGVPVGLGGKRPGSRLGPEAMRVAEVTGQLRAIGYQVEDRGDVPVPPVVAGEVKREGINNFDPLLGSLASVRERVTACIGAGKTPLVLGGDHSIAIATVAAARSAFGENLGVLWIDAHADLNTPDTSPSMNLHGMPLGLVCGYEIEGGSSIAKEQWHKLRQAMIAEGPVSKHRCFWLGLREIDPGEVERLRRDCQGRFFTMHGIDRDSMPATADQLCSGIKAAGITHLWISFDVDVLDPFVAPGVGTGVRGGLTYREAHLLAEILYERIASEGEMQLAGVDVCEVNPLLDKSNETALIAAEWLSSLFGKRII
jgi:arginase